MTRAEQREKRRFDILAAGLELFINKGYAATKIQDIAKAAGMSAGLLFHYFDSKEKLYEELIHIGVSGPRSMLDNGENTPLAFFETAARDIFTFFTTEPFVAKMFVLMAQAQYNAAAPESVKTLLTSMDVVAESAVRIEEGQRMGEIRPGDSGALAIAFWSSVTGIAQTIALTPGAPCPDSDWIVDILRRPLR